MKEEIQKVSKQYIREQMQRLGLNQKDLSVLLGINKATISEIVTGDKPLTNWHQATFYYFFKYFDGTQRP